MSISRISQFEAREGRAPELRELLVSVVETIKPAPGCRTCQLLRNTQEAGRFVIYELWDDESAQRAAANTVPPGLMQKIVALLVGTPRSAYYRLETDR